MIKDYGIEFMHETRQVGRQLKVASKLSIELEPEEKLPFKEKFSSSEFTVNKKLINLKNY